MHIEHMMIIVICNQVHSHDPKIVFPLYVHFVFCQTFATDAQHYVRSIMCIVLTTEVLTSTNRSFAQSQMKERADNE